MVRMLRAAGLTSCATSCFLALVLTPTSAPAQSQAINGTIEGTVVDDQGAVLPGVTVTLVNVDTGDSRVVVTNESGLYRAPLLPLGRYRVSAELQGFRKFEQTGVTLSAGRTAVLNVKLTVGAIAETITVTGDTPIVDLGRIEQGRVLTETEIKTLPLTSRNPYNFAVLQPGVVGFGNPEFGVPRITANGALVRVNYQIDGSNNTQKDRAGLRQMPMSEVMIREVKIVTTGYAPEFGQTMGMIYNAITPSGTNTLKGQGSYRMQRKPFAAFPFFTQGPHTSDRRPPTDVNVITFDIGGPVIRDKAHFFGGYEHTERDLWCERHHDYTGQPGASGIERAPVYAARSEHRVCDRQGRTPVQSEQSTIGALHLFRQFHYEQRRWRPDVGAAWDGFHRSATFDRGSAHFDVDTDRAERAASAVCNARAGSRPRIAGGIRSGDQHYECGQLWRANQWRFGCRICVHPGRRAGCEQPDAHSWRSRAYKFGFDAQHVADTRTRTASQSYTFSTVDSYLAAVNGTNRFGYTTFSQLLRRDISRLHLQPLWSLRPGRLEAIARCEDSLRGMRRVRRARGASGRSIHRLARFQG